MLTNHIGIDENTTVGNFLKDVKEKKHMQYFILETTPRSFVDVRSVSLKLHDPNEKFKALKKPLTYSKGSTHDEHTKALMETGERVVETAEGYFDFVDALKNIFEDGHDFLNTKIKDLKGRNEIFALNPNDKISTARNLFVHKRVNILPVIEELEVVGEVRTYDLLATDLFMKESRRGTFSNPGAIGRGTSGEFYSEKYKEPVFNLPVENIMNNKPLTISNEAKLKDAINIMLEKKLPSIIVIEGENKLYSIVSYKDVFKLLRKDLEVDKYTIEYIGASDLYPDEFDLIQDFVERSMKKITKISKYDLLKVSLKSHGNTEGTHMRKFSVALVLSEGNHIIHADREMVGGTTDEESNDRVRGKWNVPLMVQEALSNLEKQVKEEKRKNNNH